MLLAAYTTYSISHLMILSIHPNKQSNSYIVSIKLYYPSFHKLDICLSLVL